MIEALERVSKGRTIISVTHYIKIIKRVNKVLVIENDKVVESDTYNKLVAMKGKF